MATRSTRTRSTVATTATTKTKAVNRTKSSVDKLAAQLESGLSLSGRGANVPPVPSTVKGKTVPLSRKKTEAAPVKVVKPTPFKPAKPLPQKDVEEDILPTATAQDLKLAINAASRTVSELVELGWKVSQPLQKSVHSAKSVTALASTTFKGLRRLRELHPGEKEFDRVALSFIGKLIALELYDSLPSALRDIQLSLIALLSSESEPLLEDLPLGLLYLPLPTRTLDEIETILISTYLQCTLYTTTNILSSQPDRYGTLHSTLLREGSLCTWLFSSLSALPPKTLDSFATRAYAALTKHIPSTLSQVDTLGIRFLALSILLHSPSLEPANFWGQTYRFGDSFCKAVKDSEEEVDSPRTRLLSAYRDLIEQTQRRGCSDLLQGRNFVKLCEHILALAKAESDLKTMDFISIHLNSGTRAPGEVSSTDLPTEQQELESTKACLILSQANAALERIVSSADTDHDTEERIAAALGTITSVRASAQTQLISRKVVRAMERLRRTAVTVFEDKISKKLTADTVSTAQLHKLLHAFIVAAETCLRNPQTPKDQEDDLIAGALETIFALARISMTPNDPVTYNTAYQLLESAVTLVESVSPGQHHPTYWRCISHIFWQQAATLANAQKYAGAIRFVKQAAVFGTKSLRMYEKRPLEDATERKSEKDVALFGQLKDQLFRRWELLGICHGKIGDRRAAQEAWVESVKTFNYNEAFVEAVRNTSSSDQFMTSTSNQHLGVIIDRLTYTGACDLFLGPDVSLKSVLNTAGIEPSCILAVLERQIASLRPSQWKNGVQVVIRALLQDCLVLCEQLSPMKKLHILVAQLEHCYQDDGAHLDPAHIVDEIEGVLHQTDIAKDPKFVHMRAQYRVSANLWMAFHLHQTGQKAYFPSVIQHFQEAVGILQSLVIPRREVAPKTPAAVSRAKTTTKKASVKSNLKTPSRALVAANVKTTKPEEADRNFSYQNPDAFITLLHTSAQLLALLGLVGLRIQLLVLTRRLTDSIWGSASSSHIRATTELAHEYMKLGQKDKANSLHGQTLSSLCGREDLAELRAMLLLRQAQCLAAMGKIHKCSTVYSEAATLSKQLDAVDKTSSTSERIRHRVQALERAALASEIFAQIQLLRDDPVAAMGARQTSLRLWTRAADALTRLQPQSTTQSSDDDANPFDMSDMKKALPEPDTVDASPNKKRPAQSKSLIDGLEWRIAEGLLSHFFAMGDAYFARGSPREVEYFAVQAKELAESMDSSLMVCRAMMRKGEAELRMAKLDDGYKTIVNTVDALNDLAVTEAVDIRRLQAYYNRLIGHEDDAEAVYNEALAMIDELEKAFAEFEVQSSIYRKSITPAPRTSGLPDTFLPGLVASLLQERIWVSKDGSSDELNALLNRLLNLNGTSDLQAEGNALVGKLTLYDTQRRLEGDVVLGSLGESTVAIPTGMSGDGSPLPSPPNDVIAALNKAEALFWSAIEPVARRGGVLNVRDCALSLALIQAYFASLGKKPENAPLLVANLLDYRASITLEREMLEAIDLKFPQSRPADELTWPVLSQAGTPAAATRKPAAPPRQRGALLFQNTSDNDEEEDIDLLANPTLKEFWKSTRERYFNSTATASSLTQSRTNLLPPNWRVVHIGVSEDKSTMFLSRQQNGRTPLVFRVPLKGRREQEDDEHLTFEDAVAELQDIIKTNDESARSSVAAKEADAEVKAAWWAERNALDVRMKELLDNIEFCWLGAFKTILSPPTVMPPDVTASLRARFDKVFKFVHGKKKTTKRVVRLDDDLLECFGALSPSCRDEELEDLIYFILDLYQLHGFAVAVEEVDVDEVGVFLRTAFEEFALKEGKRMSPIEDAHTFLVLDKNVQHIPWESIPVLRGQSVSRVPSMAFLLDRLHLARLQKGKGKEAVVDRVEMDVTKTYYVLNPNGDLVGTEKRFAPWLKEMDKLGWEGVVGEAPSEQQVLDALSKKDLFIYFGHGGAEQYVRSRKIRALPRCAATMLWGCSSGALRDMGEFDRIGTPNAYAIAGCPTLVANLWDVTDRDIDKFTQSVFDKLRITPRDVKERRRGNSNRRSVSVVTAVAESRDVCKLKYLNGAAPVVFGVPFYL